MNVRKSYEEIRHTNILRVNAILKCSYENLTENVRKSYQKKYESKLVDVRHSYERITKKLRNTVVEQTISLAARACVNVRIGEFMLGNSRTKLAAQCMLHRRGQFEGVAQWLSIFRSLWGRLSQCWEWPALHLGYLSWSLFIAPCLFIYRSVVYNVTRRPDWLANFSDWRTTRESQTRKFSFQNSDTNFLRKTYKIVTCWLRTKIQRFYGDCVNIRKKFSKLGPWSVCD